MLASVTLRSVAAARLADAEVLLANSRFDGAGYICGYAVELALKARVCDVLNWQGYPENRSEFANLLSFKTHNLDVLLALAGRENHIKQQNFADWSIVAAWNPEARYQAIGGVSPADALAFVRATKNLIAVI